MTAAWRLRLGFRAARRAAARRAAPAMPPLAQRRVLVLLPASEEAGRAVWQFLGTLALPPAQIRAVALHGRLPFAPDAFAGAVLVPGPFDWRGLPRPADREAAWTPRPDVALDLSGPLSPASALLAGAAPAALRVGCHAPRAEPFYDLLIAGTGRTEDTLALLRDTLARIRPPALPLR
ncbi:MAG: hypothetical protein ACK41D_08380 [Rubricoccaceae bacterium]